MSSDFPQSIVPINRVELHIEQRQIQGPDGSNIAVTYFLVKVAEAGLEAIRVLNGTMGGSDSHSALANAHVTPIRFSASTSPHHSSLQINQPSPAHNSSHSGQPTVHPSAHGVAGKSSASGQGGCEPIPPVSGSSKAAETPKPMEGTTPMPPPVPREGRENFERFFVALVLLTVSTMKFNSQKTHPNPPHKEIKEPETIAPKPHVDMMRLEPQAKAQQQQQQQNSSSNGQKQENPPAAIAKPGQSPDQPTVPVAAGLAKNAMAFIPPVVPPVPHMPDAKMYENPTLNFVVPPVPEVQEMHQQQNQYPKALAQELLTPPPDQAAKPAAPQPQANVATPPPADGAEQTLEPNVNFTIPVAKPQEKAPPINRPADEGRIAAVQGSQVKPRVDAALPRERHDAQSNALKPQEEHKVSFRLPITPDLALSKEGILKKQERSNGTKYLAHDGYRLGDILLMMVCAVLCGARSVHDIFRYLDARRSFFIVWLGLKQGIPSARTLYWVLNRLKPQAFQELMQQALEGKGRFVDEVQVWDSDRGLIFGELLPLQKKEKPSALKEMVDHLDFAFAAASVDAKSLHPEVANALVRQGGDYIMAIRGSHGATFETFQEYFEAILLQQPGPREVFHEAIKAEARTEQRELTISRDLSWIDLSSWLGAQSAVRLVSDLHIERRRTTEKRYYLTSLSLKADAMAANIRLLSLVEQRVEWLLDCDFERNKEALKIEHGKENIEALIKCSWRLLANEQTVKGSFEIKRQKARHDNSYLRSLIAH